MTSQNKDMEEAKTNRKGRQKGIKMERKVKEQVKRDAFMSTIIHGREKEE